MLAYAHVGSIPITGTRSTMTEKVIDDRELTDYLVDQIDEEARCELAGLLETKTLSALARQLDVNKGLISYVINGGHSPTVLRALNMPVYEKGEAPICLECGYVHTMHKSCAPTRRVQVRFRKSADMESVEQQDALDLIAADNGFDSFTHMCRQMAKWRLRGAAVIVDADY